MTYNVFSGTLNPAQSQSHPLTSRERLTDLPGAGNLLVQQLRTDSGRSSCTNTQPYSGMDEWMSITVSVICAKKIITNQQTHITTRMWANAQRDGRPAEYRWCPLFNAAVWLTPTTRVPCSNAAKTWKPLKFAGVPQTRQQILAVRRPKHTVSWGHVGKVSVFNTFFPIVDICLSCEDTARQSCAMVSKWRVFCVLYFQRAACSTFPTCILNSH